MYTVGCIKLLFFNSCVFSAGVIGCGYFHACRNFSPAVSDMIVSLVSAGRILWQWTKVIIWQVMVN